MSVLQYHVKDMIGCYNSEAFGLEENKIYLVGYVYRTFDVFCDQKRSGTPLERLRDSRGGQKPSSFPFGMIGFSKPVVLAPWKGQR